MTCVTVHGRFQRRWLNARHRLFVTPTTNYLLPLAKAGDAGFVDHMFVKRTDNDQQVVIARQQIRYEPLIRRPLERFIRRDPIKRLFYKSTVKPRAMPRACASMNSSL